ncbi:MAG: hypothetical protein ACJAYN_002685 [Bermanella sp.]|jgi:hypothetical protein
MVKPLCNRYLLTEEYNYGFLGEMLIMLQQSSLKQSETGDYAVTNQPKM